MKIAILTSGRHDGIGGTETYNETLIKFLIREGHKVKEYYEKINSAASKEKLDIEFDERFFAKTWFSEMKVRRRWKREVTKIANENDLVIISGGPYFWDFDIENVLFIQHFNHDYYINKHDSKSLKFKKVFDSIFSFLPYKLDPISRALNVLYFDEATYSPRARKDQNKYSNIPFFVKQNVNIKNCEKKGLLFVGRIEKGLKNIPNLIKNVNGVDYYGSGKLSKKISNDRLSNYMGFAKSKDLPDIFSKYNYLVLPSISEGFGLVVVEAAAVGTKAVIFNTFDYAKVYEKIGIAKIVAFQDWEEFNNSIKFEYDSSKIKEKTEKYFSKTKYEKNWKSIINQF